MDSGLLTTLLPLVLIGVIFYFLVIRPAKARQAKQRDLVDSIGVGTEIMTTSGIFGTVRAADDEKLYLEIAPGTTIAILRAAVAKIIEPELPSDPETSEA